jgi:phosphoglycerate kinase
MRFNHLEQFDITGKTVFLRLDLNVPMKDGVITDDTRIREALPTLQYILERTNKVIVASHLGRPKGDKKNKGKFSLEAVGAKLAELLKLEVVFISDYEKPIHQMLLRLEKNQFILLENLRFHPEETQNNPEFSEVLATSVDFYINDAFGVIHRSHASVVGVPERISLEKRGIGFLIKKEIEALDKIKYASKAPFTVLIGGAKVSDKIGVILNLLDTCNNLLIGGAMAYTFLKAKGEEVGSSLVEEDKIELVNAIYRTAEARKVNIYLPVDHVCGTHLEENTETKTIEGKIPVGMMGLDIGPRTLAQYSEVISASKTIFWNGPMGVFEWKNFSRGTIGVAKAIAKADAYSVAGGGDSVAAINVAGVSSDFSHISTGGGAALEYLEGKILPGLKTLNTEGG